MIFFDRINRIDRIAFWWRGIESCKSCYSCLKSEAESWGHLIIGEYLVARIARFMV